MTLEEIQSEILRNIKERDALAFGALSIYRRAAETDHALELAKAKSYLNVEGTIEARKAQSVVLTDREALNAGLADAESKAMRDRLHAFESTISALQSLLKMEMLEMENLKYGRAGTA